MMQKPTSLLDQTPVNGARRRDDATARRRDDATTWPVARVRSGGSGSDAAAISLALSKTHIVAWYAGLFHTQTPFPGEEHP